MESSRWSNRQIGAAAVGLGILLALFGLLADVVGYGAQEGFGPGQIIILIVGLGVAAYGLSRMRKA